jgi:hypothetical protein
MELRDGVSKEQHCHEGKADVARADNYHELQELGLDEQEGLDQPAEHRARPHVLEQPQHREAHDD